MDSIGLIGLVAGLWFALSPAEERRSAPVWLCWLLAGTCTVLLLAGTLTEPLTPQFDSTGNSDWTTDPTPDTPPQQSSVGGTAISQIGTSGTACSLACG